ncbi:MAG TPA: trypsin-like peptidase domain-containing protein, partial [Ramlibacter sp.]
MANARTIHPLLGAVALLAAAPSWALAPDELFRQVSPSVWQVGTLDGQGKPIATGSAVVIAPATLVTNCHVLKGAARVVVRQHTATHAARLQHADTERDLCQLTAASLQAPAVPIAPAAAQV